MPNAPRQETKQERQGRKNAGVVFPTVSIPMIRRLQRRVESMVLGMSLALVDVVKLVPVISAITNSVIAAVRLNPQLHDAVNDVLKRGIVIPIAPLSNDIAKPFPREIMLSGDVETVYQRCVGSENSDDVETLIRYVYCGYAVLTLISLVGMARTPPVTEM